MSARACGFALVLLALVLTTVQVVQRARAAVAMPLRLDIVEVDAAGNFTLVESRTLVSFDYRVPVVTAFVPADRLFANGFEQ